MQTVIFIGIQASGKSTFYAQYFFKTHIRLNLDMLRTRHREQLLFNACLAAQQAHIIDNTNPTIEDRARYIGPARMLQFRVIGYYFETSIQAALERNARRIGKENIPEKGIRGTHKRLQPPTFAEGFDQIYSVSIADNHTFIVKEWPHELDRR